MDYLEIMSFCGYDMEAADRMVNEIVKDDMEGASTIVTRPHITAAGLSISPDAPCYYSSVHTSKTLCKRYGHIDGDELSGG